MVKTPYIFSQIQRKPFSSNPTFRSKVSLEISPKAFKTIDVSAFGVGKLTSVMLYQTMHIPVGRNTSIPSPGIRINDRASLHPRVNQRQQCRSLDTSNEFSPYKTIAAQDTKHRLLARSTAPLSSLQSLHFSLILPLTSYIGLINFHLTLKHLRYISQHNFSYDIQCPQYPPLLKPCLRGYLIAAQSQHEIPQYTSPLPTRKSQRQLTRNPFISTLRTPQSPPSYFPLLSMITLRTFVVFHATILYCWWLKWYLTLVLYYFKSRSNFLEMKRWVLRICF
jgi:hypothetical protein